jgi:hypothetical protein
MLSVRHQGSKLCDGITRRELIRVGGLSLFGGMTLPRLLAASESATSAPGPAKSVILFNLLGGPSHIDMFDMKPDAPLEIRGEFQPIESSLPGLPICEHLPQTARWMHRASLIRTVTHTYDAHNPLALMTGFAKGEFSQLFPKSSDPPDIGAVCKYLGRGPKDLPGAVCLPCYPGWGDGYRRPGPYGGFLGNQYDPLFGVCQPTLQRRNIGKDLYDPVLPLGEPKVEALEVNFDLDRRRSLLAQLDGAFEHAAGSGSLRRMSRFQEQAFGLLSSNRTRNAFDISQETDRTRDRYGRNLFGSSMLIARRLVEGGVPFISVHFDTFKNSAAWDTHGNNFGLLKEINLPVLDAAYPALLQDLEDRGLLDSTLVIVMGEMGRTPRVGKNRSFADEAGRDHWPQCGFSLFAGGGAKSGCVFGASDSIGAWPKEHPVSPGDVVATIYQLLGIDPHLMVPDQTNRPHAIAHGGEPIWGIIA